MRRNRTILCPLLFAVVLGSTALPPRIGAGRAVQETSAETYYQKGLALVATENFEDAVAAFTKAVKLKPDYAEAYYHLGESYQKANVRIHWS